MDINRERAAGGEGGTAIRLRYSRQFQSGGHAHSIDAEASLPVGAGPERREQIIREMESDVEQLARQIVQRTTRAQSEPRAQAPTRPATNTAVPLPNKNPEAPVQRQTTATPPAATHTPVSESMPATPMKGSESNSTTVRLPQFINAINKRWHMSPKEAMDLLNVTNLDSINLREAYTQLQTIMETQRAPAPRPQPQQNRITHAPPIVEAPRQAAQSTPPQSPARQPLKQAPTNAGETRPQTQGQAALQEKEASKSAPPALPVATPAPEPPVHTPHSEPEAGFDFTVAPKAPLPIKLGVIRDLPAQPYKFEEEEDAEEFELPDDDDAIRLRAQFKLDELREARGTNAASAERLTVLNNVIDGQISEEHLERVMQAAWNVTSKKRLKSQQVEKLISWAKEDYFAEEVEAMLALREEGEG